jgi:hypothetical protein
MNYTEAMNEAAQGKKLTREAWLEACFLRAEKFDCIELTPQEFQDFKKQIFVSVFNGQAMEMRFLFFYCEKNKTFYKQDLQDITAEDWRVYEF